MPWRAAYGILGMCNPFVQTLRRQGYTFFVVIGMPNPFFPKKIESQNIEMPFNGFPLLCKKGETLSFTFYHINRISV